MDNEIIEQLFMSLANATKEQGIGLFSEHHKGISVDVSLENFHELGFPTSEMLARKVCFIDGGNLEIFSAPNFSVQLIRLYYTIYANNKRIHSERSEFFCLVKSAIKNGKLYFETEAFGKSPVGKLSFYSYDQELRSGVSRIQASAIGNNVRKLCEIRIIEECAMHLDRGDFVIMDGELSEKTMTEHNFFESAYRLCDEKGIIISALAKTNTLLTDSGDSLTSLIFSSCPDGEWAYYPLVKEDSSKYSLKRCMVKLNLRSNHSFKLEIRSFVDQMLILAQLLKANSVDPVFLGYPYGLIEADRFARVTKEELEYLRTKLLAGSERGFKTMSRYFHLMDAHDILDNIG